MPCFSTSPVPNTKEYAEWLPQVQPRFELFARVVDYYYRKAGLTMPQPGTLDTLREWLRGGQLPSDALQPTAPDENARVLRQILLHLDCDGVDVFHLNDIGNFLISERTPQRLGYAFVLNHCFAALRKGEV